MAVSNNHAVDEQADALVSRRSDLQAVARAAAACSSGSLWPGREAGVCGGVCCGLWLTAGHGHASGHCCWETFTNAPSWFSWFYQSQIYWGNMKGNRRVSPFADVCVQRSPMKVTCTCTNLVFVSVASVAAGISGLPPH